MTEITHPAPRDPESGVARSSLDHSSNGIVILGMHRSGTSLLAQLVYHWGAFIDTAGMLPSNIFNPKGYWEPAPLVRFNDQLLSILQSRWSVPPRDDAKIPMAAMARQDRLRQRAVDLLSAAYAGGGKPWFWKDPRLAILLPFWKHFLGDVLYFVSLRDPCDIAQSLRSRDGISIPDSLLLWQKYMLDILADEDVRSTGIFLIYENLLADPPGECARLCRLLDQRFSVCAPHPDDRLERMVATVDAGLWRNRSQAAFTENPFATAVQKRLYDALIERAAGPDVTGVVRARQLRRRWSPLRVRIAPQDFPLPADWRVELSSSNLRRRMGIETWRCQVYWRAARSQYSEADSNSVLVRMEGEPQFLKIPIPGSGDGAAAIRLDLSDRPALVWVTQMELRDSAANVIWAWDRCADSMARLPQNEMASCTSLPGESGCLLELPGFDPWIEIVLDQAQTAATREGAMMVLECTYSASLAYAQLVNAARIHEVLLRLDDVVTPLQRSDDRQTSAYRATASQFDQVSPEQAELIARHANLGQEIASEVQRLKIEQSDVNQDYLSRLHRLEVKQANLRQEHAVSAPQLLIPPWDVIGESEIRETIPKVLDCTEVMYLPYRQQGPCGIYDAQGAAIEGTVNLRGPSGPPPDQSIWVTPEPAEATCNEPDLVYVGHIYTHFGHFLTETLSRFWYLRERPSARVLFHSGLKIAQLFQLPYVAQIFEALSLREEQFVQFEVPTLLQGVTVPQPSYEHHNFAHQIHGECLREIGAFFTQGDVLEDETPLYLSKARLPAAANRVVNEQEMEDEFARQGVRIVHPETLSMSQRIDTLRRHRTLLGTVGSHFHSTMLLPEGRRIVGLVCNSRRLDFNYVLIDKLSGNKASYYMPSTPTNEITKEVDDPKFTKSFRIDDPVGVARELLQLI